MTVVPRASAGGKDVGANTLSADGVWLTELGVLDPYLETWERVDNGSGSGLGTPTTPTFLAMELTGDPQGRTGFTVVTGAHFGRAVGRPTGDAASVIDTAVSSHSAPSLQELAGRLSWGEEETQAAVDGYVCEVGIINTEGWTVVHSTRPAAEGSIVFPYTDTLTVRDGEGAVVSDPTAPLLRAHTVTHDTAAGGSHVWRVVHSEGSVTAGMFRPY